MTATVTSGATGKVTFYDGVKVLGVATVSGSQATLTTAMLASGTRSLRAYYPGDGTYASSSSTALPQVVAPVPSMGLKHAVSIPSNSVALAVAVGDFNGDNYLDVVTATGSYATVFLGNGDGTFQTGVNYATPSPRGVTVGDFNGDGKADLAVTNRNNSNVSILLGNGDGTFQTPVNYAVGVTPYDVAVADLNADGKADLIVSNYNSNSVSVLLGNGDGSFPAAVNYTVGTYASGLAVGDLNNDGKPDVVVATNSGYSVLLGNGTGGFTTAVNYNGNYSYDVTIALGDFNGDGKLDVALGNYYYYSSYGVSVALGNGDGTFAAATNYGTVPGTYGLVVGDVDGDGKLDIAATAYNGGSVTVLYGNGDGTFRAPSTYPSLVSPWAIAAGDFTRDGRLDLIVTSSNNSGMSLLPGGAVPDLAVTVTHPNGFTQGQSGAQYAVTVTNAGDAATSGAVGVVMSLPPGMVVTNINGAGWTCDIPSITCVRSDSLVPGAVKPVIISVNVPGNMSGNVTATFAVSGGGDQNGANNTATDVTFVRFSSTLTFSTSPNPSALGQPVTMTATITNGATGVVEFLDGANFVGAAGISGSQAILAISLLPSGIRPLRAVYVGDANYGPSQSAVRNQTVTAVRANGEQAPVSYKVGSSPQWIGTGDFNRDGKVDLLTMNNGSISVMAGNGDGTFGSPTNFTTHNSNSAVLADFNGDGKVDVAVVGYNGLSVLLGNGDGTFQTDRQSNTTSSFTSVAAADFNRDGKQDLVMLYNSTINVLMGNGDGTFQPPVSISVNGTNWNMVKVADMNQDGIADLVALGTGYGQAATIYLGNGDGTFQSPLTGPPAPSYPSAYTLADFNGDGKIDLADIYWNSAGIQLGNGNGTLQATVNSQLAAVPGYFALAGDFDGDGKLDIAFTGYTDSSINILFGNGDGTFQTASWGNGTRYFTSTNPSALVQGDFNGDGKPDFAVTNSGNDTVQVFLGAVFAGLTVTSSHTGTFTAGQTGTYTIAVQNPTFGNSSGTVSVNVTLPAGITATSISSYYWSCTLTPLACSRSDSFGNYVSSQTITITVSVSPNLTPGTVFNRVTLTNGNNVVTSTDATRIVASTNTSLSATPAQSMLGQPVALTATVTAGSTGTVIFSDGGSSLGIGWIVNNQASLNTRLLSSGTHSLRASYVGDTTHAPSVSAAVTVTISTSPASGFATARTYTTGAGPSALAIGDFNRDGRADLVTANATANTVSVLMGSGTGTFGASTDYAVGTRPLAVVTGDFNNDGITDLAVANQTSNNVSILLGNADGTFQTAVSYGTGSSPSILATGDLNSDGKLDLVVGYTGAGTVVVLLGNGDGTFPASGITLSSYSPYVLAVGDFNRDGKADLAFGNYYVTVQPGNGDGTFSGNYNSVYFNYTPAAITLADINADGKLDMITADSGGASVALGNGDGTFQPATHYSGGNNGYGVVCADINGDGKLDVAVVNNTGNTLSMWLGNGNGTLQTAITYGTGASPKAIAAGDFNGDGRTDLAVANFGDNNVSVLLGVLTPILGISSGHAGSFNVGQTGAVYTINVLSNGPGTTSGVVTVTDVLPAELSATAMGGAGWNCTLSSLTCTRSDALSPGASYSPITLTVNVVAAGPASVLNVVNVSGGGAIGAGALDSTAILAAGAFGAIRIHGCGGSYTDSSNNVWSADTGYLDGACFASNAAIAGALDQALYQSVRFGSSGSVTYQFNVPNGAYSVLLKFAELFYASAGQRVFDVMINGTVVTSRLDPFAAAGGTNRPYDLNYPVAVTNGVISITVTGVIGYPILNALQVTSLGTADFALTASPATQTVVGGNSASYAINSVAMNGFNGSVAFSAAGLPAGASATFTPSSFGGSGSTTMNVTTNSSVLGGLFPITVTGTSGALARRAIVPLAVVQSSYRVNCGGSNYTDSAGQTWFSDAGNPGGFTYSSTATVANTSDSALYQTLRASPGTYPFAVPNGSYVVTLKFAELYYTSANQRVFDVAINGATVLSHLDIFAAAGGINRAYDVNFPVTVTGGQVAIAFLNVTGAPVINAIQIRPAAPDFGISATPAARIVSTSSSTTYTITTTATDGFNSAVGFSVSGLPTGATASFNPSTVAGGGSTTMTVTTAANTPGGTVPLSVTGTSGILSHNAAAVSLTVVVPSAIPIRVNAGGLSYTDSQTNPWSADTGYQQGFAYSTAASIANTADPTLYQTLRYNAGTPLVYQFGVPNGSYTVKLKFAEIFYTSANQRMFDVAINGSTVISHLDIVAAAGGANRAYDASFPVTISGGQITITLTGVVGLPVICGIEIAAPVPDFSVTASPSTQTVTAGNITTYTITTTAVNGFNGVVSFAPSGVPGGAGVSFNPATVTGSGSTTMTVNTSGGMAAGSSTITVTATSGALTHSTSATVVVTAASGFAPIRVNAGGPAYTDWQGSAWSADTGYQQGVPYSTAAAILNTNDPTLFQTLRYGVGPTLTYQFAVPNGNYDVNLRFAELYYTAANQRVFDVAINGVTAISHLDIFAAAGGINRPYYISTPASVTGGQITITMSAVLGLPVINAFEIVQHTPDFALSLSPASRSVTAGGSATFTVSTNADPGFNGVVSFSASGLPSGATASFNPQTVTGGGTTTMTVNTTGATPAGTYHLSVAGTSGVLSHPSVTSDLVVSATSTFIPIRVNAGGPSYTDSHSNLWSADTGAQSGYPYSTSSPIANTTDATLYQTLRYNTTPSLVYTFTVPNGSYTVTLKFAELYYTSANQRVQNVAINNATVASNLDIFAAAGGINRAYDVISTVSVTNGQISINVTGTTGLPVINAIEIR